MKERILKINRLIKEKIADIVLKEIFFKNTLITIQSVDTSKDLKYSKIKVSVMPFIQSSEVLKILQKRTPNIQKQLNKFLKIKFVPRIIFKIDRTEETAGRIEGILRKLKG